ncbi:MAG: hypothetical protein CVV41_15225 [Candidatus Riflebacteria bacterium HGW-Riflebacteria-1]|nr:MAG: hypothetical protein CVV41_15225 [Candidatus Riflebacteria bacterium HGW-Riflebacteria-1]
MNRKMFRGLIWILILQLIVGPAALWAQTGPEKEAPGAIETMLNYDYKTYAGKVLVQQIMEDLKAGRPIDMGKVGEELTGKPFLVQAGLGGGSEVLATGLQYASAGICPPFGMIVGSTFASAFQAFGGAVGYEAAEAMKSGEELTKKQILGKALSSIDMPSFIGQTAGSVVGSMIGQALIPIPIVGMIVGGIVGGIVGNAAVSLLSKIPAVASAFAAMQKEWEKIGKALMKKNPENQQEPEESPQATAKAATTADEAAETPSNRDAADLMNVAPTVNSATTGSDQ